jgi:hypothetical protein
VRCTQVQNAFADLHLLLVLMIIYCTLKFVVYVGEKVTLEVHHFIVDENINRHYRGMPYVFHSFRDIFSF